MIKIAQPVCSLLAYPAVLNEPACVNSLHLCLVFDWLGWFYLSLHACQLVLGRGRGRQHSLFASKYQNTPKTIDHLSLSFQIWLSSGPSRPGRRPFPCCQISVQMFGINHGRSPQNNANINKGNFLVKYQLDDSYWRQHKSFRSVSY